MMLIQGTKVVVSVRPEVLEGREPKTICSWFDRLTTNGYSALHESVEGRNLAKLAFGYTPTS